MYKPNEGRLEAIAFNALQESRKAHGVGEFPWADKDARLQAMIVKILEQVQANHFNEDDVGKLVPVNQASMPKPLVDVENLLEEIEYHKPSGIPEEYRKEVMGPVGSGMDKARPFALKKNA
jgi:hypothetical protein